MLIFSFLPPTAGRLQDDNNDHGDDGEDGGQCDEGGPEEPGSGEDDNIKEMNGFGLQEYNYLLHVKASVYFLPWIFLGDGGE